MISHGTQGIAPGERIKTGVLFTLGCRGAVFTKIGVVNDDDTNSQPPAQRSGFMLPFQRLYNKTQPLVRAVAAHQKGKLDRARQLLWHITHADEKFFLAIIDYQSRQPEDALRHLEDALTEPDQIGRYFHDYEIPVSIGIQLGLASNKSFGPEYRTYLIIYAELCLEIGQPGRAYGALKTYINTHPTDLELKLYIARFFLDTMDKSDDNARYIVGLTDKLPRRNDMDGELHLIRAKALLRLNFTFAAQESLQQVIDQHYMPADVLVKEGYYQLHTVYELQGRPREAIKQLRQVYERDRGYRDVAERMQRLLSATS
ncbi:MAG: hypothetical protein SFY68_02695 [Candidatus Sumerlaeia bacterium]|nr:hypothetical protein [Candidatus Sumerlaeia bacterium]